MPGLSDRRLQVIVAAVGGRVIRRRWRPLVGLVVVVGLLCGVGMAAMAGARRTQSAYPRFLRWANVSTMAVDAGQDRNFLKAVEGFPEVVRHRRYTAVDLGFLTHGVLDPASVDIEALASVDGRYFDQDRFVAWPAAAPTRTGSTRSQSTGTPLASITSTSASISISARSTMCR
jgi:hypothetical protein